MAINTKTRELLAEYKNLNDQIKELETRQKEIKELVGLNTPQVVVVDDNTVLALVPNRSFSAALAQELLPPDLFEQICVSKPDTTLAKKFLTGQEYEELMATNGVKWTWKENK